MHKQLAGIVLLSILWGCTAPNASETPEAAASGNEQAATENASKENTGAAVEADKGPQNVTAAEEESTPTQEEPQESISEVQFSKNVLQHFRDYLQAPFNWLKENKQDTAVLVLSNPEHSLTELPEGSSYPELSADLYASLLKLYTESHQTMLDQLKVLSAPEKMAAGHQSLMEHFELLIKRSQAYDKLLAQSNYASQPSKDEIDALLSEADKDKFEDLSELLNPHFSELQIVALQDELESLIEVSITDLKTYSDKIEPFYKKSKAYPKLVQNPFEALSLSSTKTEDIVAAYKASQKEIKENLANISRIRPPKKYAEMHALLYAQEKFNLEITDLYEKVFNKQESAELSSEELNQILLDFFNNESNAAIEVALMNQLRASLDSMQSDFKALY